MSSLAPEGESCPGCGAPVRAAGRFCPKCGRDLLATASTSAAMPASGPPSQRPSSFPDPMVGRTLGGSYLIKELIGSGGMAKVYRAEQTSLGRSVAVKVMRAGLRHDERLLERFYVEARAASTLNHPNSVAIIDFGAMDDGAPYLVMEHLEGRSLGEVYEQERPLSIDRVLRIAHQVLGALEEAHLHGITHRDLKPDNVLVVPKRDGSEMAKVVDFGIARLVAPEQGGANGKHTLMGTFCGTPEYVSPEQARGLPVDGAADLYSFGVILFELITDRLPYDGEDVNELVGKHLREPVPDPRELAPERGISDALAEVVMRAMAKKVTERYESAAEVAQALRQAQGRESIPGEAARSCGSCGASLLEQTQFCGQCGARVGASTPSEASPELEPRRGHRDRYEQAATQISQPLIRAPELEELEALDAEGEGQIALLRGPAAARRRSMAELVRRAEERGDPVVRAGPHPSRAPVPYAALRQVLDVLSAGRGAAALRKSGRLSALERAGAEEIAQPRGIPGSGRRSRAEAAAVAFASLLAEAARTSDARLLILLDDVDHLDPPSVQVLQAAPEHLRGRPVRLILSAGEGFDPEQLPEARVVEAREDGGAGRAQQEETGGQPSLHTERLSAGAREATQAAAVFGYTAPVEAVTALVGHGCEAALEEASRHGLVSLDDGVVRFDDPHACDLLEGSIPAEKRRALHDRAFEWHLEAGSPAEVCAEHAARGGQVMRALLQLDRAAARALAIGDTASATGWCTRAIELARRQLFVAGDETMQRAMGEFTAKLAEALLAEGEVVHADGAVREALSHFELDGAPRGRLLVLLGRTAAAKSRRRDAHQAFKDALAAIEEQPDGKVRADSLEGLAELHAKEGRHEQALQLLSDAEGASGQAGDGARKAALVLRRGQLMADDGRVEQARAELERALRLADEHELPALAAMVLATRAELEASHGNGDDAAARYREAARRAAEAGDVPARDRWREAADAAA